MPDFDVRVRVTTDIDMTVEAESEEKLDDIVASFDDDELYGDGTEVVNQHVEVLTADELSA